MAFVCLLGAGDESEGFDGCESCDFILQTIVEDGQTSWELWLEMVSKMSNNSSHAGDGSLLNLLVNVSSRQSNIAAIINLKVQSL